MPSQNGSLDRLRAAAVLLTSRRRRIEKTTRLLQSSWDLLRLPPARKRARKASGKKDGVNDMSRQKPIGLNRSSTEVPIDGRAGYEKNVPPGAIDPGKAPLHLATAGVAKPCWICGRVVSLESCKTDEHGNAVHEACYVARVSLNLPR